jgi:hypothetical protein
MIKKTKNKKNDVAYLFFFFFFWVKWSCFKMGLLF